MLLGPMPGSESPADKQGYAGLLLSNMLLALWAATCGVIPCFHSFLDASSLDLRYSALATIFGTLAAKARTRSILGLEGTLLGLERIHKSSCPSIMPKAGHCRKESVEGPSSSICFFLAISLACATMPIFCQQSNRKSPKVPHLSCSAPPSCASVAAQVTTRTATHA